MQNSSTDPSDCSDGQESNGHPLKQLTCGHVLLFFTLSGVDVARYAAIAIGAVLFFPGELLPTFWASNDCYDSSSFLFIATGAESGRFPHFAS